MIIAWIKSLSPLCTYSVHAFFMHMFSVCLNCAASFISVHGVAEIKTVLQYSVK